MDINTILFGFGVMMVLLIIVGFGVGSSGAMNAGDNVRMNERREELKREIEQLNDKRNAIESVDRVYNLQDVVIHVLDEYEQDEIRIQADILEDLNTEQFISKKEVREFIEFKRNQWKIESNKKPRKRNS